MDTFSYSNAYSSKTPDLLSVEQVSDGWIKKYLLTYRLVDGAEITYESVSRKSLADYRKDLEGAGDALRNADAISVAGCTPEGEILLIKEFRYPLNSWCIAFPAGLLEPGESMFACAQRELQEETGYSILYNEEGEPQFRPLPQAGYSSVGMSEESVHLAYALVEKTGEPRPEHKELIEVFTLQINEIPQFLQENTLPIGTRSQLVLESFVNDFPWSK